ncbi:MAG: IPT/TIG domain-containing protein [Actinobacteria bacterium]|nr:IPT/TIG domain-containing protein [Actinomycetota bacterium]
MRVFSGPFSSNPEATVRRSLPVLTAVAVLLSCASANAAPITLGSPLAGTFLESSCGPACTLVNQKVSGSNPVASPVNGAVIRWRVTGASAVPGYEIRVLRPSGFGEYTAVGTSAPQTPSGPAQQSFATNLPIKAGDLVGIDTPAGGALPINHAGGEYGGWVPLLAEGQTQAPIGPIAGELGYNAEVQPAPTIVSLGTTSGSTAGGTSITINGTDFEGTSAVKFGTAPASSFTVNSESQITALAPAAAAGSVPVTVTTVAGTATSAQLFTYVAPVVPPAAPAKSCIVPSLKGKKLGAARKSSLAAGCRLGEVTKRKGITARSGKVVRQTPKAGTVHAAGTKIKIVLGG